MVKGKVTAAGWPFLLTKLPPMQISRAQIGLYAASLVLFLPALLLVSYVLYYLLFINLLQMLALKKATQISPVQAVLSTTLLPQLSLFAIGCWLIVSAQPANWYPLLYIYLLVVLQAIISYGWAAYYQRKRGGKFSQN